MEAPRGAREPTGTNGPTPHQPPQPRHPTPPNGEHRHKGGPGTASPGHRTRGNTGGRATRHPPPPPGPRTRAKTRQQGGARRSRNHYTNHDQPTPHPATPHDGPGHPATQRRRANKRGGRTTQACGGHSTGETPSNIPNLEAKPGRANGTAPQGVRESRKPPQHTTRGAAHTSAAPPHTPTRTHPHAHATTRTRAREQAGTQHARSHTPTRARHQRGPNTDHANTRARTSAHEPHPRATTRTRASYCARPPSGLRLFMFQQSSGR